MNKTIKNAVLKDETGNNHQRARKFLIIACNSPMPSTPFLGVTSIATYLISNGVEVKIFDDAPYMLDIADEGNDPREKLLLVQKTSKEDIFTLPHKNVFEDLLEQIRVFEPILVGISINEATYKSGIQYLQIVRDKFPHIKTIAGGVFGILDPGILLQHNYVDMVAVQEGEYLLKILINRLAEDKSYLDVKGLWVKDEHGKIRKNPTQELINVNEIGPLMYHLYRESRLYRPIGGSVKRVLPLEISRGCVYKCKYCSSPVLEEKFNNVGKWYRRKTTEKLDKEIATYIKDYSPEYFMFISETFLAMGKKDIDDFVEMYSKYKVPFWMNTRPETINDDVIKKLKEIGLKRMSIGVECGNEEYRRKTLRKGCSNKLLLEGFDILRKYGIAVTANVMIGLPEETKSMIFESIKLMKELKPTSVALNIFQPFRGTHLYDYCIEKGYYNSENFISPTTWNMVNLRNPFISEQELFELFLKFNLYVKTDESEWSEIDEIYTESEDGRNKLNMLYQEAVD